jgi:hypothetical protein
MKYLIARPIEGLSINGNEYLSDDKGNPLTFESREECSKFCKEIGLDDSYIWLDETKKDKTESIIKRIKELGGIEDSGNYSKYKEIRDILTKNISEIEATRINEILIRFFDV